MIDIDGKTYSKYVGIPFKTRSFDKNEGLDCLTFIITFLREVLNKEVTIDIPMYGDNWYNDEELAKIYTEGIYKYCNIDVYSKHSILRVHDLLFFSYFDDVNRITHAGIYIGQNRMIHCTEKHGVIITKLSFMNKPILLYGREL